MFSAATNVSDLCSKLPLSISVPLLIKGLFMISSLKLYRRALLSILILCAVCFYFCIICSELVWFLYLFFYLETCLYVNSLCREINGKDTFCNLLHHIYRPYIWLLVFEIWS